MVLLVSAGGDFRLAAHHETGAVVFHIHDSCHGANMVSHAILELSKDFVGDGIDADATMHFGSTDI